MSQPTYTPQPGNVPPPYPPPPSNSNRTLWIILGSVLGGGFLLLICVAVVVIGVLSTLGARVSTVFSEIEAGLASPAAVSYTDPIDASAAIAPGETARVGDFDVVVRNAWVAQGNEYLEPAPGYKYRAVEFTITNRGTRAVNASDAVLYSWVQDADGETYECCIFDADDAVSIIEPLGSGETGTTVEVYEVPEGAQELYFVYEHFDDDSTRVAVALP
jgi:hypothetical protein